MKTTKRTRAYDWDNPEDTAITARHLKGMDFLTGILKGEIPAPPVAQTLDFQPVTVEEGNILFKFTPAEFHYNPIGSVHGGVISTLLDTVTGCAVHSMLPKNKAYTTLELKVNFIRAVTLKSGEMYAEGRLIHLGKSTALAEAYLKNADGTLYAYATSTCMILEF